MYIVLFLHQTTTGNALAYLLYSCISYYSYIKPQQISENANYFKVVYRTIPTANHNPEHDGARYEWVVYRTIPTSNHNLFSTIGVAVFVVYRTIPTSNHNAPLQRESQPLVVYRTIPTSNHNCRPSRPLCLLLYIVLFLHQTTTLVLVDDSPDGCISYYSYIKPQHLKR